MKTFEAVMILEPNETIAKAEIRKFTKLIQDWNKKDKVKVEDLGLKGLAYEIRKHERGYYAIFTFKSTPENIAELERLFRIDDHVLKFIVVRKEDDDEFEEYDPEEDAVPDEAESEQDVAQEKPIVDVLDIIYGLNKEVR